MNAEKRVLSIDGGGIKGVFPASFLATVEDSIGDNVANYFDLIVGTSTGGIIALGLGLGLSAKEILAFYEESGPLIFGGNRLLRGLRCLSTTKYNRGPLNKALKDRFGDKKLGDSTKRLVIPCLNLETGEVHVYKTAHHPRLVRDYKEEAVEVALATAAAPTYFPPHRSPTGIPLVDGGIWANNPVCVAVVEAITLLDWPRDSLKVLSIGCTTEPLKIKREKLSALGALCRTKKLLNLFMFPQSKAALGMAKLLAGHDNVIRIDRDMPAGRFSLDNTEEICSLKGLGSSEARDAWPKLREIFLGNPAEPFNPVNK